ncbi:MAG: transglycosylase SLT domain-containing protein [Thermoleophilaceae bacterium]
MLRGPRLMVLVFLLAVGGSLSVLALAGRDGDPDLGPVTVDPDEPDPFAYEQGREDEFVARATAGHSHVLYEKSPDGVLATARRVERWRSEVEEQAGIAEVDADLLEAMVFLESAGYPDARASDDLEGAVGLTQILAETGTNLLGMRVDVEESERLTRRIARAEERGETARAERLRERRREVDERFDPSDALQGAGRYLQIAEERFGGEELAVVSYHMGIGNLESVLDAYGERDVTWARVYFDATPRDHPSTYRLLSGFGDDSATYLWRVYATREIMRLYREDRGELLRLAALHRAKASAEEVLHPRSETDVFETPSELDEAYLSGELRPFADVRGMRLDPDVGELAGRLHAEPRLYRGLRPEAHELAVYLSAGVRDVAGTRASLVVTSTVRDLEYQRLLARRNAFATREYSLHTTGFAFDVRRDYASRAQAVAFEYMLDRLQSLNLIAWVREPGAIHITASSETGELVQ